MIVGEDLDAFSREISARFGATSAHEISDLAVKMAGFDLSISVDAMSDLRTAMPSHHRMVDGARLLAIARRKHVEQGAEIRGESPKKPAANGIPFDLNQRPPDRRSAEQKRYDEQIKQSREWVESLDPDERKSLLEEALLHWPDGDERAMYRQSGVKVHLVRFEMIRVSERREREASVMA